MAAYNKFDDFVEQLCLKKHELNADLVKIFLSNELPLVADTIKTDIADIAAGNGYTAGGDDVTNTLSVSGGTVTMVAVDVVWTASVSG